MKINYNPAAQNTLRHFGMNVDRVDQSMRNLSSGKKVIDGTDGGASLYVTTNMQNKVTGLKQAQTNTETSLSLLQTAEAAMAEGVDILNQMKQNGYQIGHQNIIWKRVLKRLEEKLLQKQ